MDCFLCTIIPWPVSYVPYGWTTCEGQLLAIQQYAAINALLGPVYGGDGKTTFGVPDLSGCTIIGQGLNKTSGTRYYQGRNYGAPNSTVSVTANNLPSHTHSATVTPVMSSTNINIPAQTGSGSITATGITDVVGGGAGVDPVAGTYNYYLTGVTTGANGPVTTTAPTSTTKAGLIGTNVTVDMTKSTYSASTKAATVPVSMMTNATVAIGSTGGSLPLSVPTMQPSLALYFILALSGNWPDRG